MHCQRTPSGHRFYTQEDIDAFLGKDKTEHIAFYVRSSKGDKEFMDSQLQELTDAYGTPKEIYKDKASGLNENRKGLQQAIKAAENGTINVICATYSDGVAYLSIAMKRGRVTLSFPVPKKNDRFKVGNRIDGAKTDRDGKRITVPNIRFDDKGISFDFTVESPVPQEYDALCNWVCCDQGIVEPVVATFVNGVSYSQPLYMPRGIQSLSRKRARLWKERNCLLRKELLDEAYDNLARYIVHHTERMRVQAKLSNLKREIAVRCAHYLTQVAVSLDAGVALEQLAWSSGGYNWFHGILTGAIEYSCARAGVPCDRFGAAHTSDRCAFCGSETRASGRDMICDSGACACHDGGGPRRVNRDVQASRRGCVRMLNKVCVEEVSSLSVLGYERIRFRSVKRAVSVSHGGTGCSPQATTARKGESLQSLDEQKSSQEDGNSPNSA